MELLRFTKLMMGDDEAMVFRILFLGGEEGGSFLHNILYFKATEN